MLLSLVFSSCSNSTNTISASKTIRTINTALDTEYTPVNNLKGDYYLFSPSSKNNKGEYNRVAMAQYAHYNGSGLRYSTTDNFSWGGEVITQSLFSINPIDDVSLYNHQGYHLSMVSDEASYLAYFSGEALLATIHNNAASYTSNRFYIDSKTTSQKETVYRLSVIIDDYRYFLSNTTLNFVAENSSTDSDVQFILKNAYEDSTIPSSLYLNTGTLYDYSFSSKQLVKRSVNDYIDSDLPRFSRMMSFSLSSDAFEEEIDESLHKHYRFGYDAQNIAFNASFTYIFNNSSSHSPALEFIAAQPLHAGENNIPWRLTYSYGFMGSGSVSMGGFIVQKYNPYSSGYWVDVERFEYISGTMNSIIELDWKNLLTANEQKYRICFIYSIESNPSNKKTARETRNLMVLSDEFYVSYSGFSSEEFLPIQVKSISLDEQPKDPNYIYESNISDSNHEADFDTTKLETLLPGSLVKDGFTVESLIQGYSADVEMYVPANSSGEMVMSNEYKNVTSQSFTSPGRYHIITHNSAGEKGVEGWIEVSGEDLDTYLFKNTFSNTPNSNYFVSGSRMYSGPLPEEFKNYKINYRYANYNYPTYYRKVTLKGSHHFDYIPNLSISIVRNDEEPKDFSYNIFKEGYVLNEPGFYQVIINAIYNEKSGINGVFAFRFYIVEDAMEESINTMMANNTNEYYDLQPYAYTVYKSIANVKYKNGQDTIQTTIPVYYAFATYQDALNYSISKCKQYAFKLGDDEYSIMENGVTRIVNEVEAFQYIYKLAKEAIEKKTISVYNIESIAGFDLSKQIAATYESSKDVPDYLLVTTNNEQLMKLTKRQLFNNYIFIKDDNSLVSSNVSLADANGTIIDSNFPYMTKVEDYMLEHDLPTGDYIFIDQTNVGSYKIYRSYIVPHSDTHNYCDAVSTLLIGEETITVDMSNDGGTYNASDGFVLSSVVNKYDDNCLVTITYPSGVEDYFSSSEINNLELKEVGTYVIYVQDRVGNHYSFNVKVGA